MNLLTKNLWIINQFSGHEKSGWGERHYYLSKYFLKNNYNVTIFSGSFNHMFKNFPHAPNHYNIENIDGINFCWIKTPYYKAESLTRFWSMLVFAIKLCFLNSRKLKIGKPNIILVSSMPIFSIISGIILKKIYGSSQLIFEVRDLWPLTPMLIGGYSKYNPFIIFIALVEKIGYRKSDKIVSLLPNAATYINKISRKSQKLFHIPNGYYKDSKQNLGADLNFDIINELPSDKFLVGYTGTIGLANAMEHVVDAAFLLKDNKNIHFVIVGEGYKRNELIKRSFGLNNISFLPKVSKLEVQSIIKRFNICLISWRNSPLYDFGVSANKYFDYMEAGKPILVAGKNAKDPVGLSGCGIIVNPENPQAIAGGILIFFAMTDQLRESLGNKGKQYVKKHHNYEHLANQYIKLFESE